MLSIIKKEANTKDRNNPILEVRGLSTDDKPLENITNGSEFIEIDTGDKYFYNAEGSEWIKMSSGGGSAKLQDKEITITENTTTTVIPDTGFDGLRKVDITTNVPSSGGKYAPRCISFAYYDGEELNNELANLDISNLTSFDSMFNGCYALEEIDLSGWDTSNITDMGSMFNMDEALTELDLSNFDTSNVESMTEMFSSCPGLTSVNVSSFDTSKCTSLAMMFSSCSGLTTLDLSSFTANPTNLVAISGMFYNCTSLEQLDISNFDFTRVDMEDYYDTFWDVPTNCLIYVKDQASKNFFTTYEPQLTNVQIKAQA